MSSPAIITSLQDYTKISDVDDGVSAEVFLCVETSILSAARRNLAEGSVNAAAIDQVVPQIRAVKEYVPGKATEKERDILLAIRRATTDDNEGHRFVQLLGYDTEPSWLMLSTMPACCTLRELASGTKLPYQFAWLLFLELFPALRFLQRECNPPIAHCDLHSGNVLIGFDNTGFQGPLKFLLIDLGDAETITTANTHLPLLEWDMRDFHALIADVAREADKKGGKSSGWKALCRYLKMCIEDTYRDLETTWKTFGPIATDCVERFSVAEKQEVVTLVRNAVAPKLQKVRGRIREFLLAAN